MKKAPLVLLGALIAPGLRLSNLIAVFFSDNCSFIISAQLSTKKVSGIYKIPSRPILQLFERTIVVAGIPAVYFRRMTLPTAAELLKPILATLVESAEPIDEPSLCLALAVRLRVSEDDRRTLRTDIKSRKRVWDWRVHNAIGLLDSANIGSAVIELASTGSWRITPAGRSIVQANLITGFDSLKVLSHFSETFSDAELSKIDDDGNWVLDGGDESAAVTPPAHNGKTTPADAMEGVERAYITQNNALAAEVLEQLKQVHPTLFERIVVDVLVAMGYGGTERDAAKEIKPTGSDGGIDGTIKEDRLGLGFIYIQAKRWQGSVGRPEIQQFAGALQGKLAKRGVFITTSTFTNDAKAYVKGIEARIVLVDGPQLAELMIEHGIGVTLKQTLLLRALDHEYFTGQL